MKSQIFLYLFCGLGLWWAINRPPPTSSYKPGSYYKYAICPKIKARAYVWGEKYHLLPSERKAHYKLHLTHLFTPSGIHLSALLLFPAWFLKRRKKTFLLLLLIIFVLAYFFSSLHSFKRMCLVALLSRMSRQFNFRVVAGAFLIDLIIGGFWASPLSWFMSLLFLGTIALQLYSNKRTFFMAFLGGQALVGLLFSNAIYPVGMVLGWLVMTLFSFIFPLLLVESFLLSKSFFSLPLVLLVKKLSLLAGPSLAAWAGLAMAVLYFLNYRRMALLLLLLLPINVANLPRHRQKSATFPVAPPRPFVSVKYHAWGSRFDYKNGMVCRSRLYLDGWSTRCRK